MPDRGESSFDGDDLATWAALATMLEWLPPALDEPLQREHGLTHFEYGVLFALADSDDHSLRMSVLAGYANSTLSRLSRAVGRLEARGWTRRAPDPTDGRFTLATLTAEGLRGFRRATTVHEENVRRLVLDALTPTQKKRLREIASRVMHAVRETGAWPGATWGATVGTDDRRTSRPPSRARESLDRTQSGRPLGGSQKDAYRKPWS